MIASHFKTLIHIWDRRQRATFFAKGLLWICGVIILLLLSEGIQDRLISLCDEYGDALVSTVCFFLAAFALLSIRVEYSHILSGTFPTADYAFYQSCGMNKRSFRTVQIIHLLPLCVASLFMSCVLCFPFLKNIPDRILFIAGWLVLLVISCSGVEYKARASGGINGPVKIIRDRLLSAGRLGAMLAFSFYGAGTVILFLLLLSFGVILTVLVKSFWITGWLTSWFSFYFAILTVDDYEKQIAFHQMYPRTYKQIIKDDSGVSAVFCGINLLIQTVVFCCINGIHAECFYGALLMWLYAFSNHAALYLMLEPLIPARKISDSYAPGLIPVIILQLVPGVSPVIAILRWIVKRRQLLQAVPWGKRVC